MTESFARSILYPCSKCDKVPQVVIVPNTDIGSDGYNWHVECPECGERSEDRTAPSEAIKVWNDTHPKEGCR